MEKSKHGVEQLSFTMQKLRRANNGYPIEMAIDVLEQKLEDIPNVTAWAERMNYSRSHFSAKIKEYFGKAPSGILWEIRMKHIRENIQAYPNDTSYAIAKRVGLKNDNCLYKFLSRHYDTNFRELRKELISSDEF